MATLKCDVCGRNDFRSMYGLTQHMHQVHPDDAPAEEPPSGDQPEEARAVPRERRPETKPGTLDRAIERLMVPQVPEEYNGAARIFWEGFNRGVSYGANTILVGIRSAQELSSLGIAQATPLIRMAQEMRQAEGQAAQEMAAQLTQATVQGNQQVLSAIHGLAASRPEAPNPMAQVVAESMKPFLQQVLQNVLGGVLGGFQRAQIPHAPGAPASGQHPPEQSRAVPQQGGLQQGASDGWGALPDNVSPIAKEDKSDV